MKTSKVGVVQATPALFDADKSVDLVIDCIQLEGHGARHLRIGI